MSWETIDRHSPAAADRERLGTKRATKRTGRAVAPVVITSLDKPNAGWTMAQAVGLVEQGYSLHQAARMSGFLMQRIKYEREKSGPSIKGE